MGSFNFKCPLSYKIITAAEVIGLVIEKILNNEFVFIFLYFFQYSDSHTNRDEISFHFWTSKEPPQERFIFNF